MRRLIASLLTLACAVLAGRAATPTAAADENWPQWRGPEGAGIGRGTYPDTWSATSHIAWKTPLNGRGHSSPVVWGNRIFLTTSIEGAEIPGGQVLQVDDAEQVVANLEQHALADAVGFDGAHGISGFERFDRFLGVLWVLWVPRRQ